MHGIVDEKTNVYSFGVLLLELITGRKALNRESQSLLLWAKPLLDDHNLKELVDPALGDDYDYEELDHMVLTTSLCTQQTPVLRPPMNQDCSISGGGYVINGGNQWTRVGANYNPYAPASYANFLDKNWNCNKEFQQSVKQLQEKAEELKGVKEDLKIRVKQTTEHFHNHVDGVWIEAEETAKKMGAKSATITGLAGIGDIMLTCFVKLSRNRAIGLIVKLL